MRGQWRKYNISEYEKISYHSLFLNKNEMNLEVLNLLTLHYQRDLLLNLKFGFVYSLF